MDTIFDYLVDPILIIPDHFRDSFEIRSDSINSYFKKRKNSEKKVTKFNSVYNPVDSKLLYIDCVEWEKITSNLSKINFFEFREIDNCIFEFQCRGNYEFPVSPICYEPEHHFCSRFTHRESKLTFRLMMR